MEFPRVRRTRSKRSKTTQNQVGGAPAWVSPTPSTYFTSALWTPKLTMPNAGNIIKLLTDPDFIKFTTQYSPEYYTAWLDAIKYQDQIYCAGLEIIIEEITGKTGEHYADVIEKIKSNSLGDSTPLRTMFTHLEHTLSLGHGTDFKTAGDPTNKFEHMFKERIANSDKILKTEMAHLLLNPKRIENILVQSIAQIIVMLKDPGNLKEITESISNEILKKALINKWVFFSVHGTELQTNEEIRDAFLTGSEPCEVVRDILPFWTAFVEEIAKPGGIDVSDFPLADDHSTYGKLAAGLAKSPNLLDDITKVTAPDLTIDYSSIPDGIDSSFGIFKKLAPNLVFFLKHLEGAIEATSSSP